MTVKKAAVFSIFIGTRTGIKVEIFAPKFSIYKHSFALAESCSQHSSPDNRPTDLDVKSHREYR